jgi:acylpyruvate hydrolase
MRFVTFKKGRTATLGIRRGAELIDLSIAAKDLPQDLASMLAAGKGAMRKAEAAARKAPARAVVRGRISYLPPITDPGKIICVGLNYKDHAAEANMKLPDCPVLFPRYTTTLVGHKQPMIRPKASRRFDYEAELVAVIGKKARHVPKSKALDVIAGYSIFNEGSIRDFQMRTSQWTLGKNFDGTGGFGPEFVTADELPPGARGLRIQARLNGKVLQDDNTRNMIFDVRELIKTASQVMTLMPGDIIVTGTPAGVGFARKPPVFMKQGDICEIEIEGIGTLVNPIRNE